MDKALTIVSWVMAAVVVVLFGVVVIYSALTFGDERNAQVTQTATSTATPSTVVD